MKKLGAFPYVLVGLFLGSLAIGTVSAFEGRGAGANSVGTTAGIFSPPLSPANGGVGTMTGAPMWARYYGDGSEGPVSSGSSTIVGVHFYTTFNCNGTVTVNAGVAIFATTSIALASNCIINATGGQGTVGIYGATGGTGGGGTLAGGAGNPTNSVGAAVTSLPAWLAASATSGSSGAAGNAGIAVPAAIQLGFVLTGIPLQGGNASVTRFGGSSSGSAGGSSGGVGGNSAWGVALISSSVTIANGALINAAGGNGAYATASTQGGGGGGGGGPIFLGYQTLTDSSSGTYFKVGGGAPGGCTTPGVVLTNAAGDSTGGGAILTVTGVTTGGLDASKITITAAGTGYTLPPVCTPVAGASGLIGTPACHTTLTGSTVGSVVIDTAGSGATFSAFATCGVGGVGGVGWVKAMQAL